MHVARPLKAAAVAALSSMVAAVAIAGPLAGTALAGQKKPTPIPDISANANVLDATATWLDASHRTNSQSIQFSWAAPASGTTLTCSVDGAKAQNCTSPSPPYKSLANGTHTFLLKGKAAGFRPGSKSFTWTVDTTAPLQPSPTSASALTGNTEMLVSWTDTDTVQSYACQLLRDSVAQSTPFSCGGPGHSGSTNFTGLTDDGTNGPATYVAKVWALDDVGNPRDLTQVTPGSATWTVDQKGPRSPMFGLVPSNPSNSRTAHFTWTDSDFGAGGSVTSFNCFLNGDAFTGACSAAGTDVTVPTDGQFTFAVQGVDNAQNVGAASSFTWNVLTAKPTAPFLSNYPALTTDHTDANFSFGDTQAGVTYLCTIETPTNFQPCQAPKPYSGLADGVHHFFVEAKDVAGNISDVTSYDWTINTSDTSPVVVSPPDFNTGPAPVTSDISPAFTWTDSDLNTDHDECKLDSGSWATCASGQQFAAASQVTHELDIRSVDAQSNKSPSVAWKWLVDTTAPTKPVLSTKPATVSNSSTAMFSFASDAGVLFTCSLDGATASLCASPATFTGLSDGSHTFDVTATDAAGNFSTTHYDWAVDTSAPKAPSITAPPALVSSPSLSIQWQNQDAGTPSFSCAVDNVALLDCTSPVTVNATGDQPHTFTVSAANGSGHSSKSSVTWTLDTTNPVLNLGGVPADGGVTALTGFTPIVSETDAHPGSWTCNLSGPATATDCGPYSGLTDGTYTLTVDGTDAVNNPAPEVVTQWTVDTTAPVLVVDGVPTDGAVIPTTTVTPDVSQDDANAGDSTCSLAGPVTAADCGPYTDLTEGAYTLTVDGSDAAGNPAPEVTTHWIVDKTAPVLVVQGVPADGAVTAATTVAPQVSQDDANAGTSTCSLAGPVTATDCGPYTNLTEGSYTLTVDGTDAAGNAAVPLSRHWTVDKTAPSLNVTGVPANGAVTSLSGVTPVITETDPNPGTWTCVLTGPVTSSNCGPYTALTDGSYTLKVDGADAAGNPAAEVTRTWAVDRTAPVLTVSGAPTGVVNATSVTLSKSQTELHPGSITCSLTGPVSSSNCGPYTNLTEGVYTLKVDTTDVAGNKAAEVVKTWTVDTTAPVLTVSGAPSGVVKTTGVTLTKSQTELHPGSITCSLTGPVSSSNCGPYTNLTDGAYTLKVDTTDVAGNKAAEVVKTWTVDTTAPVLTVSGVPTGVVSSTSVTPSITQVDANAGALVCSLTGPVTSSNCGPYAGLTPGDYTLKVDTTDKAGNAAAEVVKSWTVATPPTGPVDLTSPTATIAATKTLTGASKVTFSETVHGLTTTGAALLVAGTSAIVPSKGVCLSGATVVACGGIFTALRLTPRAPLMPGQHYTIRLLAGAVQDAAGNPLVAKSLSFRGSRAQQETTPGAKTLWATGTAKRAFGGSFVRENSKGASATYTFTGTNVTWWTATGPNQGKATVFIDGVRKGVVNNYAATQHFRVGRTYANLANKRHTIRIVVRGVKGRKAGTDTFVTVDAFSVGKKRVSTPALKTGWRSVAVKQLSGGHAVVARTKGETLTFAFRGTSVSWVTERGRDQGKVAVYIDGVRKAVVDNYAAATKFGVKRTIGHLTDKVHTLKLVVLGRHHKGGIGTWVTVDRFLVA